MRTSMKRLTAVTVAVCFPFIACSSDEPSSAGGLDNPAPILNGTAGGDTFIAAGGGNGVGGSSGAGASSAAGGSAGETVNCGSPDQGTSCVGETYAGESIP